MLAAPPHRSEPSTARAARPPLSGGGGGGDGDDFGALAANVARGLDPPPEEATSRPWVWPLWVAHFGQSPLCRSIGLADRPDVRGCGASAALPYALGIGIAPAKRDDSFIKYNFTLVCCHARAK
jgi:hypothetical protein